MWTIKEAKSKTTATTPHYYIAVRIADALLEYIGDEGGVVEVVSKTGSILALYNGGMYIVDGDVYHDYYDASDSMSYRIQALAREEGEE